MNTLLRTAPFVLLLLAACQAASSAPAGRPEPFHRSLAALERSLPPDHPDLLRARLALARTLLEEGYAQGARELLEPASAALERTLGPKHPLALEARHLLARARA